MQLTKAKSQGEAEATERGKTPAQLLREPAARSRGQAEAKARCDASLRARYATTAAVEGSW
ncbi:MAG: hypothetical protein CMJ90_11465 [Planctomycetes bacterium]|nr:hypothetical protein [Planctomycetota bacterium]